MIPLGILASAGAAPAGAYELISTQVVSSGSPTSVTFSTIPSTYRHLQVRFTVNSPTNGNFLGNLYLRSNGLSSGYVYHYIAGNGSAIDPSSGTSATYMQIRNAIPGATNIFGAGIIEVLDYTATNKVKTIRAFAGANNVSERIVALNSGFVNNTGAITSLQLLTDSGSIANGSRFSLYGIKG